ncbi:MAG: DotU family type IV/VI secretion system protein [Puniceicoccales bacterium]
MKALPQYQDFFSYVARLQRWLRQGGEPKLDALQKEALQQIDRIDRASRGDPLLRDVFKRVRLPIIFYIDHVIVECDSKISAQWRDARLAYQENELAGDEKFFDITDELMQETTPVANESLAIIYQCMGLGFTGWYANQPEHIRELMETIAQRLPEDFMAMTRVAPEAYQPLDTRNLIVTARSRIGWMILAFVCSLILAFSLSYLVFFFSTAKLRDALNDITAKERFLYPNANENFPSND